MKYTKLNNNRAAQNIQAYFSNQYIVDRIYEIHKDKIDSVCNNFFEEVNNNLLNILKKANLYKTMGARNTKMSFCEEKIFLLLFSSLHPAFYAKYVIYITNNAFNVAEKDRNSYPVNIIEKNINFDIKSVPDAKNVTYFIKDKITNEVKIGKAKDLQKRFNSLYVANRHILLLGYKNGDCETAMHRKYAKYRTEGEWFTFSKNMQEDILCNELDFNNVAL